MSTWSRFGEFLTWQVDEYPHRTVWNLLVRRRAYNVMELWLECRTAFQRVAYYFTVSYFALYTWPRRGLVNEWQLTVADKDDNEWPEWDRNNDGTVGGDAVQDPLSSQAVSDRFRKFCITNASVKYTLLRNIRIFYYVISKSNKVHGSILYLYLIDKIAKLFNTWNGLSSLANV